MASTKQVRSELVKPSKFEGDLARPGKSPKKTQEEQGQVEGLRVTAHGFKGSLLILALLVALCWPP